MLPVLFFLFLEPRLRFSQVTQIVKGVLFNQLSVSGGGSEAQGEPAAPPSAPAVASEEKVDAMDESKAD